MRRFLQLAARKGRFCFLIDKCQETVQLCIVVEHLLEKGRQPHFVDGILCEAAADMVVDAALANIVQTGDDGNVV